MVCDNNPFNAVYLMLQNLKGITLNFLQRKDMNENVVKYDGLKQCSNVKLAMPVILHLK